jgi:hypothetical protein
MTLYKLGSARFDKWKAKYDPTTVGNRFTQVSSIAADRAQQGLLEFASVQDLVRPILDKYGVTGPDRALYLGFANKLLKHALRVSGTAGTQVAAGLKAMYVTAFKADPSIIDEIIQVVTGYMTPY